MPRKISDLEIDILLGAVADLHRLQKTPMPAGYGKAELKMAIRNARDGYVRCQPFQWTDGPTEDPAYRMRLSRAYASLERRGLIQRVYGEAGRCTTDIAPSKAGITLATELRK